MAEVVKLKLPEASASSNKNKNRWWGYHILYQYWRQGLPRGTREVEVLKQGGPLRGKADRVKIAALLTEVPTDATVDFETPVFDGVFDKDE